MSVPVVTSSCGTVDAMSSSRAAAAAAHTVRATFPFSRFHPERLRERPDDASATGGAPLRCHFRPWTPRKDERGTWPLASLASLLGQGEFVVTAELNPPKSAAASVVKRRADLLKGVVDAVNLTDSNRANVAMAAIPAAVLVRDAGVEPIVQVTGRDRNRIALQADLLGAAALGLPNFLFMTGDDPKQGNHPEAVHVKDLDGLDLVRAAASLRDGKLLNGDEVKQPPRYFIGATASPSAPKDVDRTLAKIAAGAQFIQTQPVFDIGPFSQWLAELRKRAKDVAVLAGVLVLRSADQAERLAKSPGFA